MPPPSASHHAYLPREGKDAKQLGLLPAGNDGGECEALQRADPAVLHPKQRAEKERQGLRRRRVALIRMCVEGRWML